MPSQSLSRTAGWPFMACGIAFVAVSAGRPAFLGVGLAFLGLGVAFMLRRRRGC